jgi:hypothetical protein
MDTPNEAPEATESHESTEGDPITPDMDPDATEGDTEPIGDEQTYPAAVVRKLRDENAKARNRIRDAESRVDELSRALFQARVAATGLLADATDLEYSADLLDDSEGLAGAINSLIGSKPHLKARKVSGDAGLGNRGDSAAEFSLLNRLKGIG